MDEQLRFRQMRRDFSGQGWALLIYLGIMNVIVMLFMIIDGVMAAVMMSTDEMIDVNEVMEMVGTGDGWGYLLTIVIGLVLLLIWKKPRFFRQMIMARGRPMKAPRFFAILMVFISAQLFFMLLTYLFDWAWTGFFISASGPITFSDGNFSLFLYVAIGAPISEELLFRGLLLRTIEPYGKKFAIFASAALFGAFHGNLTQGLFAFFVGLILAYVTLEHNVVWAMLLHMINNMLLTETLPTLGSLLPAGLGDFLIWILIAVCSLGALIVLIAQQDKIAGYLRRSKAQPYCARAFWTAPGMITLIVVLGASILLTTVMTIMM